MPAVHVATPEELDALRRGGVILRACLEHVAGLVAPGKRTMDLDAAGERFIRDHGGAPAFKGYRGFPGTLCISVNDECVHGIPGKRALKDGDIVSLDCGVLLDGLYTDACITVPVGRVSAAATSLLTVTERALEQALGVVRADIRVGDISATVQEYVESHGFVAIPALTGHGIGRTLHQYPDVPNVGKRGTGAVLPEGAVIAIEPIISAGSRDIVTADDGWTLSSADGALTAHFEHTILITADGYEILA